jgi:hypothetical protein
MYRAAATCQLQSLVIIKPVDAIIKSTVNKATIVS